MQEKTHSTNRVASHVPPSNPFLSWNLKPVRPTKEHTFVIILCLINLSLLFWEQRLISPPPIPRLFPRRGQNAIEHKPEQLPCPPLPASATTPKQPTTSTAAATQPYMLHPILRLTQTRPRPDRPTIPGANRCRVKIPRQFILPVPVPGPHNTNTTGQTRTDHRDRAGAALPPCLNLLSHLRSLPAGGAVALLLRYSIESSLEVSTSAAGMTGLLSRRCIQKDMAPRCRIHELLNVRRLRQAAQRPRKSTTDGATGDWSGQRGGGEVSQCPSMYCGSLRKLYCQPDPDQDDDEQECWCYGERGGRPRQLQTGQVTEVSTAGIRQLGCGWGRYDPTPGSTK